ncbi:MAG: RAD55 family ATPase [Polyangiaceae bacterium]
MSTETKTPITPVDLDAMDAEEREAIQGETLSNGAIRQSHVATVDASDHQAESTQPKPQTPFDIVQRWRGEGALVRVATGIEPLDELCRGGFPMPWRVIIIGAPSAGKTFVSTVIADHIARALAAEGVCVGILAVDEEPDDVTVRLAQIAGFTVAQAEQRDPEVLDEMARKLATLDVHLYDAAWTIEAAVADLADRAIAQKKRAAFFIDSIHAVKCAASAGMETDSVRLLIQANVDAMRVAAGTHRMLLVATGEANRASYRNEQAAKEMTDMASGAESRAIEFVAQTLLMLRTPKGHPDVIHAGVPKNRRAAKGEFWLRLDRERHTLTECPNPETSPGAAEERDQKKRTANRRAVERDAGEMLQIIVRSPGIGTRGIRASVKLAGLKMGRESQDAAILHLLQTGRIENRPDRKGDREDAHYYPLHDAPGGES